MPQPAFSVRPASWTLFRMSSIESWIVPETGAVDRRGRGLVTRRAGVRRDAARGNRAAVQRPDEALVPFARVSAAPRQPRERLRDALIGAVDVAIDRLARLRLQAVLRVPDVERRFLERDVRESRRFELERHVHNRSTPFSFCTSRPVGSLDRLDVAIAARKIQARKTPRNRAIRGRRFRP